MSDYSVECPPYYLLLDNINELGLMKGGGKFLPVLDLPTFLLSFRNKQISMSKVRDIMINGLKYIDDFALPILNFITWDYKDVSKFVDILDSSVNRTSWNLDKSYSWHSAFRDSSDYRFVPELFLRFFKISTTSSVSTLHLNVVLLSYFFPLTQTFRCQSAIEAISSLIVATCFVAADWWNVDDVRISSSAYWSTDGISRMSSTETSLLMTPSLMNELALFSKRTVPAGFYFDFWDFHTQQKSNFLMKLVTPADPNNSEDFQTSNGRKRTFFGVNENETENHINEILFQQEKIAEHQQLVKSKSFQSQPTVASISYLNGTIKNSTSSSGQDTRQREVAMSGPKVYLSEHEAFFFLLQCPKQSWLYKLVRFPNAPCDCKPVTRRGCFSTAEQVMFKQSINDQMAKKGLKVPVQREFQNGTIGKSDVDFGNGSIIDFRNANIGKLYELDNWQPEILISPEHQMKELATQAYLMNVKRMNQQASMNSSSFINDKAIKGEKRDFPVSGINSENIASVLAPFHIQELGGDMPREEFYERLKSLFGPTRFIVENNEEEAESTNLFKKDSFNEQIDNEEVKSEIVGNNFYHSNSQVKSKIVVKEYPFPRPRDLTTLYRQESQDPHSRLPPYVWESPITMKEISSIQTEKVLQLRQSGFTASAAGAQSIGPIFAWKLAHLELSKARYGSSLGKYTVESMVKRRGWRRGPWTTSMINPCAHDRDLMTKYQRKGPVKQLWRCFLVFIALRFYVRKRLQIWGAKYCSWKVTDLKSARNLVRLALERLDTYEATGGSSAFSTSCLGLSASREKFDLAHLATPTDRIVSLIFAFKPTRQECISASKEFANEYKKQSLRSNFCSIQNEILKQKREESKTDKIGSNLLINPETSDSFPFYRKCIHPVDTEISHGTKNLEIDQSENIDVKWVFPPWCPRGTTLLSLKNIQQKNRTFKEEIVPGLVRSGRTLLKKSTHGFNQASSKLKLSTQQLLIHEDCDNCIHSKVLSRARIEKKHNNDKRGLNASEIVKNEIHNSWIESPFRLPLYYY